MCGSSKNGARRDEALRVRSSKLEVTMSKRTAWIFSAILLSGCSSAASDNEARGSFAAALDETDGWRLENPETFSLNMDPNFFAADVLAQWPDVTSCHTQGVELVGDEIFLSCTLFGSKADRHVNAKAFLLKANLSDVLDGRTPNWQKREITETTTDAVGNTLVLGHPSGIIYDKERGGIWSANAVYLAKSYTRMVLYSPDTLAPVAGTEPITIQDHIGTIGLLPDGRLLGMNWDSIELYYVDPQTMASSDDDTMVKVTNALKTAYQDCDTWNNAYIMCGGVLKESDGQQYGRLHLLKINELDERGPVVKREIPWVNAGGESIRLGQVGVDNAYGDFHINKVLTNEGMAVSADKEFIYFFPGDVPNDKLVRYHLARE
jgi:hypothetical protein